jgi:hypothetical protein
MITVVVPVQRHSPPLVSLLSDLVPAAVDGLVKAVVLAGDDGEALRSLSDDSGAVLVSVSGDRGRQLAAACAAVRGDWILTLDPETVLPEGWRAPVEKHLTGGAGAAAWLSRPGVLARLTTLPLGVLVRRLDYEAAGGFKPGQGAEKALIRTLGAKRIGF